MKKALLISCFGWYENRLVYISQYLKEKGFKVSVLLSDFSHIQKKYIINKENEEIEYVHVKSYKKNISFSRCLSHIEFSKKIANCVESDTPDLIWCLLPPNSLAKRISCLKKRYGFSLVYDLIDLWPESFPYGEKNLPIFNNWRLLRDNNLDEADKVVVECDYYKKSIEKYVNEKRIAVLRLIKKEVNKCESYEPFSQDVCLCYLGSINSIIDISKIKGLVREICNRFSVIVRVIGDGEHREEFLSILKLCGAEVVYYGKVFDEKQKQKLIGNCHFGINIYRENTHIGLTMKSVDYFQMGIPLLNNIPGDTAKLVSAYNAGINVDDFSIGKFSDMMADMDSIRCNVQSLFVNEFSDKNCKDRINSILGNLVVK